MRLPRQLNAGNRARSQRQSGNAGITARNGNYDIYMFCIKIIYYQQISYCNEPIISQSSRMIIPLCPLRGAERRGNLILYSPHKYILKPENRKRKTDNFLFTYANIFSLPKSVNCKPITSFIWKSRNFFYLKSASKKYKI